MTSPQLRLRVLQGCLPLVGFTLRQVLSAGCSCPELYHPDSPRFQVSVNDCCLPKGQLEISRQAKSRPSLVLMGHQGLGEEGHVIDSIPLNWRSDIYRREVHMSSSGGLLSCPWQAVLLTCISLSTMPFFFFFF